MSSTITIKVANVTSSVTLNNTDAQIANVLSYFIEGWADAMPSGLTQAQQNQWMLDQVVARIVDYVKATARANRYADLVAQQQSIADQATQETRI